jgi:hypothetical protein
MRKTPDRAQSHLSPSRHDKVTNILFLNGGAKVVPIVSPTAGPFALSAAAAWGWDEPDAEAADATGARLLRIRLYPTLA